MELVEKNLYLGILSTYNYFHKSAEEERSAWRTLKMLDRASTFTPGDWADVRKAYDLAVGVNGVFKANLLAESPGQWLTSFKRFTTPKGASWPSLRSIPWVQQLCRPIIAR
jgi:hypothetical protein